MTELKKPNPQTSVPSRRPAGIVGGLVYTSHKRNRVTSYKTSSPQAKAVKTLTVDTFTDGADYVLSIEGEDVSYTAVTGDTDQAGVASKVADQINATPTIRRFLIAEASGADVILRATNVDFPFAASTADAKLTLADTNDADGAEGIPFGRIVIDDGKGGAKLPENADFTTDKVLGVALFTQDTEGPGYLANAVIQVLDDGHVYMDLDADVTKNQACYVGLDGDDRGKVFDAAGVNRALLTGVTFYKSHGDGLCSVQVRR